MYTLPSDLFNKYVFKVRNLCCVRELLALNLYFLISKDKSEDYLNIRIL